MAPLTQCQRFCHQTGDYVGHFGHLRVGQPNLIPLPTPTTPTSQHKTGKQIPSGFPHPLTPPKQGSVCFWLISVNNNLYASLQRGPAGGLTSFLLSETGCQCVSGPCYAPSQNSEAVRTAIGSPRKPHGSLSPLTAPAPSQGHIVAQWAKWEFNREVTPAM